MIRSKNLIQALKHLAHCLNQIIQLNKEQTNELKKIRQRLDDIELILGEIRDTLP